MKMIRVLARAGAILAPVLASAATLQIIEHDGRSCVDAAALEREGQIVIKALPGRDAFVACAADRCALVASVATEAGATLVPVTSLAEALGLAVTFDERRQHVTLIPTRRDDQGAPANFGVGSLAPNLRFTKLDGTTVSLDELRGQRVLINSWASW